jgi:hypothetical protein
MEMMYEERRDARLSETTALKATELPMLMRARRQTMTNVTATALRGISQPGLTYRKE